MLFLFYARYCKFLFIYKISWRHITFETNSAKEQAITAFLTSLVEFQTLYNGILYKKYSRRTVCFYTREKNHVSTLGMSRLIGTADKSADIWRFQNNR
jgi:hypothetical protein